jgi:acyl-CoA thioesterase FadM
VTDERLGGGPASVVVQRRIDWMDTDAAGMFHNTTVWRLMEAAEATLHDRLGIRSQTFGRTPRVRSTVDFSLALAFYDLVAVELTVTAMGRSSATYRFDVRRDGQLAASGEVVTVLLDQPGGRTTPWPEAWRERLLHAGAQRPELVT